MKKIIMSIFFMVLCFSMFSVFSNAIVYYQSNFSQSTCNDLQFFKADNSYATSSYTCNYNSNALRIYGINIGWKGLNFQTNITGDFFTKRNMTYTIEFQKSRYYSDFYFTPYQMNTNRVKYGAYGTYTIYDANFTSAFSQTYSDYIETASMNGNLTNSIILLSPLKLQYPENNFVFTGSVHNKYLADGYHTNVSYKKTNTSYNCIDTPCTLQIVWGGVDTKNITYYLNGVYQYSINLNSSINPFMTEVNWDSYNYASSLNNTYGAGIFWLGNDYTQLDIFNIKVEDGFTPIYYNELTNYSNIVCNYQTNCLFYDDFTNTPTAQLYQTLPTNQSVVDGVAYIDTYNSGGYGFKGNFFTTDIYKQLDYYIAYDLNYTTLPPELNYTASVDNTETFYIGLYCDDSSIPFVINMAFFGWNNYGDNYQYTNVYHYLIKNGLIPLATFSYDNGKRPMYRVRVYKELNKIGVTSLQSAYPKNSGVGGFATNDDYVFNISDSCNVYNAIAFGRKDFNTPSTTHLIGIDEIMVFGQDKLSTTTATQITPDTTYYTNYVYTNQSNQSTSVIKSDVSETIRNWVFDFGFKTTGSKLFLVLIFILIALFFIFKANIENGMKGVLALIISMLILIVGWYFDLIPTAILIIIFFIVAIVGAIILMKLMSGGGK